MSNEKDTLAGYDSRDIDQYFISHGALLPFEDVKGRKRVAQVVSRSDKTITYRAMVISRTGFTEQTYKKPLEGFLSHVVGKTKYLKSRSGSLFYVFPRSERTTAKAVGNATYEVVELTDKQSGSPQGILDHLDLVWGMYWEEEIPEGCSLKDDIFTTPDGSRYVYGVKI